MISKNIKNDENNGIKINLKGYIPMNYIIIIILH